MENSQLEDRMKREESGSWFVKFEVEMKLARSQVDWVTENAASAVILVALLVTQAWQIL